MEPTDGVAHFGAAEFCLGRVINAVGIKQIGAMTNLRAAERRIKELALDWPGNYVVFNRDTGLVVARASSR